MLELEEVLKNKKVFLWNLLIFYDFQIMSSVGCFDAHRTSEGHELSEKQSTIEDLHLRLKGNVNSIQQLNEQLNSLNRENIRIRSELEKERSANQSLHLEMEKRADIISTLKSRVSTDRH